MSTKITNITGGAVTLPSYGNMLAPGQGIIVDATQNQAIAKLGGQNSVSGVLRVETSTETSGSGSKANCCDDDDVFIYVNAATGADNRNGSTPGAAVKTIKRALQLVPGTWAKHCQVIMAPGTYSYNNGDGFSLRYIGHPAGPESCALAFIGGYTSVLGGNRTATVGSNGDFIKDGSLVTVPNFYRGSFVSVVGPPASPILGQRRQIVGNDAAGRFDLNEVFFDAVAPGTVFVVENPNAIIELDTVSANGNSWTFLNNFDVMYKGIRFELNGGLFGSGFTTNHEFCGCQIANGNVFLFHDGGIDGDGFPPSAGPAGDPLNPFNLLIEGAGLYIDNCFMFSFLKGTIAGKVVLNNCFVSLDPLSQVNTFNLWLYNTPLFAFGAGVAVLNLGRSSNGAGGVIDSVWDNSQLSFGNMASAAISGTVIQNSSGDGIYCQNARLELTDVSGAGNGGTGVNAQNMSFVAAFGGVTVTGAGGDIQIGALNVAWGVPTTDPVQLCRVQ